MKVKLFAENRPDRLEAQINLWLEENPWVIIQNITQSTGSATYVSIWYKEPDVPILG